MKLRNSKSTLSAIGTKTALAIALLAAVSSAQASNIQFNTSGTGSAGATTVTSAIDAHGSGFVMLQANPGNPMSALFSETGAYQLTKSDGTQYGAHDITLTYSVFGALDLLSGALSFSAGSFILFSDLAVNYGSASADPSVIFGASDGDLIASFAITSGASSADGIVHLVGSAIAGSVRSGYFFSAAGDDLSPSANLQFAADIGNVVDASPSATAIAELVCKAAHFPGPGCNGSGYYNTPYFFVVSDGGTTTLSTTPPTALPEPGSAALAFAGMAGLGFAARRSRKKQA